MLIIDGYNLLWAAQKQTPDIKIDDISLCHLISQYLKILNRQGQVIFDGIGPPDKAPFSRISNVEIIFSGSNNDADSIIETKIAADSAPKRLMIVSSDQRIRKAAQRAKSASVKSDKFCSDMIKALSRKKPSKEPSAKRAGLDEAQTKQWLKYFGLEQ